MPLTVLVVFIISPTECPVKFGEHMEKMCNKSQNKESLGALKRNVRISNALVSQNVGLEVKPIEN
jgi:predicted glycosyltransferase